MRLFLQFLKSHLGEAVYGALCFLTVFAVLRLCRLPARPVLYALCLCAVPGLVYFTVSFLRFRQKHRLLTGIQTEITDTLEHLPKPDGLLEADYQALLRTLQSSYGTLSAAAAKSRQETMDYYTLWVHQIKTPIAAMQLVLQECDSPENLELRAELFQIQQYVEMVLCYLRLDSRGSDFRFRECNVDDVVRAAVHTYAGQFIRKRIRLDLQPTGLTALTDEKWLQFVVEQLLSNALKYTQSGSVSIFAGTDGVLVIRDTGIGIAQEDLPRIFEWGFTGLNGRSGRRSTGIGLYLCRRVCGRLGHKISIQSAPGQGTAVYLDLRHQRLEFDK